MSTRIIDLLHLGKGIEVLPFINITEVEAITEFINLMDINNKSEIINYTINLYRNAK